jgi:hypothetical protein
MIHDAIIIFIAVFLARWTHYMPNPFSIWFWRGFYVAMIFAARTGKTPSAQELELELNSRWPIEYNE